MVQVLEPGGRGPALHASVSSPAQWLPLIPPRRVSQWERCSRPAPGHLPGLTPTLRPAELSKPEAQPQVPDELDEPDKLDEPHAPDASDDEVGPGLPWAPPSARAAPGVGENPGPDHTPPRQGGLSPEEASPSTQGKAPRCFCTTEPRQGRPLKRKQAPSSDQRDKGQWPRVVRGQGG